jgi:excisionase family DNA binding protein
VSRPTKFAAEARALARAVEKLSATVAAQTIAIQQLRVGHASQLAHPEDAMRLLGISRATLWRRVKDGSIPCQRVGRSARFDLAALTTPTTEGPL